MDKRTEFYKLCKEVAACQRCPRMMDSLRILGRTSGLLEAKVMFIGEAPGRLGADNSGIPFHGDKSGHNFEAFLEHVGISRYDIFVTNAVLCNPKDNKGNNTTPNEQEINSCGSFLKEQIDLVNPEIIITLGATALLALKSIEDHNLSLKSKIGRAHV